LLEVKSIYRILLSYASAIRILFVFGRIVIIPVILIRPNNKIYYSVQP